MTLSLRGRLLIGVISLVVIGLLVANVAMYLSLQSFLMGRVDDQLTNGVDEAANALGATGPFPQRTPYFPVGTVVELIAPDGSIADGKVVAPFGTAGATATPIVPQTLTYLGEDKPGPAYTVQVSVAA